MILLNSASKTTLLYKLYRISDDILIQKNKKVEAPLFYGDIVMGAKISITNHLKLRFSLFFKGIFVNRCLFRDLYIHAD